MRVARHPVLLRILLSLFVVAAVAATSAQTTAKQFGLSGTTGLISREPWPSDAFGDLRLWDTSTAWGQINTSPGVYDWSTLDAWLAATSQHGDDVLYTFGVVPTWASSDRYDTTCFYLVGSCDPPNDLNQDGTGTDQHWKDFVTAIATHNHNRSTGHIKFWELWNEPHNLWYWTGTQAQLVRMAKDARAIIKSIDPNAVILSPAFSWVTLHNRTYMSNWLAAGGGQYVDVMSVHGYVFCTLPNGNRAPVPECLPTYLSEYKAILSKYGQASKPIFDTEAYWGKISNWGFSNLDMQASFVARMYLLHAATNISRFYWYSWNGGGVLWVKNSTDPSLPGTLLKPGIAYREVYNWLVGKTMNGCSNSGSVWHCNLSGPNGWLGQAVWDKSQTCSNGSCTTSTYTIDAKYIKFYTLYGDVVNITGLTVQIGAKPILLTNQ